MNPTAPIKTNKEFKVTEYQSFSGGYYNKLKSTHEENIKGNIECS